MADNKIDFMDFQEELLDTTREAIDLSKLYLQSRKEYSHYQNQIQTLIYKAGLFRSKKSLENKILELIADETYGEKASDFNIKMNEAYQNYKGLEMVIKSYHIHSSGLQSVMKQQTQGEISESMRQKYGK